MTPSRWTFALRVDKATRQNELELGLEAHQARSIRSTASSMVSIAIPDSVALVSGTFHLHGQAS